MNKTILIFGFALMIAGQGCSSDKAEETPQPPQAQQPQQNPTPVPQPTPVPTVTPQTMSLQDRCRSKGGVVATVGDQSVCKVSQMVLQPGRYRWYGNEGYFPVLTPSDPQSMLAATSATPGSNFSMELKKGDVVNFIGAGAWGGANVQSYLGGFVSLFSTNCSEISLDGKKSSQVIKNEDLPAGLTASDGTEVFLMGSKITKTINNDGILRFGFNAPPKASGYYCSSIDISRFTVTYCEDANATRVQCQ